MRRLLEFFVLFALLFSIPKTLVSAQGGYSYTVRFENVPVGTSVSMVIDGITENDGKYIPETSSRFSYSANWRTGTDHTPSGGSYKGTETGGSSFTFFTNSPEIVYRTFRWEGRGNVKVFVNGQLKTTLTNLRSGPMEWIGIPLHIGTLQPSPTPTSSPTPTLAPTPSVTPTATPQSTPTTYPNDLVITYESSGNPAHWRFGDRITFRTSTVPADRIPANYFVRYQGFVHVFANGQGIERFPLLPSATGSSVFSPMTIKHPGADYYVRFRYCLRERKTANRVCAPYPDISVPRFPWPSPTSVQSSSILDRFDLTRADLTEGEVE